jgi:hypothetical protein
LANNTYSSNTITITGTGGGSGMNSISPHSISPLSISSLSPAQTISLDDTYLNNLFKNINRSDYVKRYEVIEATEDILALSVTWKRLRDTISKDKLSPKVTTVHPPVTTLLDDHLFRKIEESDRVRANEIRDYFSKKIMLWTLKSVKLSAYRQDLNKFIHGDGKKVTEELLPLIYRLPEFYEYDIQFDQFKREVNLEILNFGKIDSVKKITTLTPIKSFYKTNKRVKHFEYWLKDSNDNAHLITIEPKNPLKHIWDKIFTNGQIRIEGTYYPKKYDELQYYQLLNWSAT